MDEFVDTKDDILKKIMILSLLFGLSCQEVDYRLSDQEEQKMKHVLIDLQTMQLLMDRVEADSRDSLEAEYWKSMEEIHGWNREKIESYMHELKQSPAYLKTLLQEAEIILDSLKSNPIDLEEI